MKKLLFAALALLLLTGCRALREPTDMFVIAGAALFWQEEGCTMAGEMGDTGSTKEDLPGSRVFTGTGETVSACLFDMASRVEREIYFGKTEVLMLEETMPAERRKQALELFLEYRSDHQVLLCALRAGDPAAALSFGEDKNLRTSVIMGLLQDGERRAACRTLRAEEVQKLGEAPYFLPEITVDDAGASLSGAAFYKGHGYCGRLEGQPVRLLCLLMGDKVESACSFHGPDWALWLKKASVEREEGILRLTLDIAFAEGKPDKEQAEAFLEQMGADLLAELARMDCNVLELPDFPEERGRILVTVNMP